METALRARVVRNAMKPCPGALLYFDALDRASRLNTVRDDGSVPTAQ